MFEEVTTGRKSAIDAVSFSAIAGIMVLLAYTTGMIVLARLSGLSITLAYFIYALIFLVLPLNSLKDDTERMLVKGLAFVLTIFLIVYYLHLDFSLLLSAVLGLIVGAIRPLREYTGY